MKKLFAIALCLVGAAVGAQTTASKKELVAKVLLLQQAAIERSAVMMTQRPAEVMMQQAGVVLQSRVAPEKREAIAKEIQADVKKYVDEAVPQVRERAVKLAPSTVGVVLEEKFSEDELKQLIAIFELQESAVNRKYRQLGAEMEKALGDKLGTEMRSVIEPKVKALEVAITAHLGLPAKSPALGAPAAPAAPAASTAAKAPAKAASK